MREIWSNYSTAWKCLMLNWRIILLLYICSLGLAFLALGPFSNLIEYVFGDRLVLQDMTSRFDYTAIVDMINYNSEGVQLTISTMLSFFIIYILWTAFYTGGLIELSMHKNTRSSTLVFWKGGAECFFRYLRLSIYMIVFLLVVLGSSYVFFSKDGLNPLHLESEDFLILRFKVIVIVMACLFFISSTFRDIAKVIIRDMNYLHFILSPNLKALSQAFTWRFLGLSMLNFFFLGLGFLLYILMKNIFDNVCIVFILSQLFFVYRLAYRFVRLASFNYLYADIKAALPLHNQSSDGTV